MKHSIKIIPLVLIALFTLTLSSCNSDGTNTNQPKSDGTTNQPKSDRTGTSQSVSYTTHTQSIFANFQETQDNKDTSGKLTRLQNQIKDDYVTGTKIPGLKPTGVPLRDIGDDIPKDMGPPTHIHIMAYLAHTGEGTEKNGSISPPNITEAQVAALPTDKGKLAFLLLNIEIEKLNAAMPATANKNSLNKANFNTTPDDVIYKTWNLAKPSEGFNVYVFQVYATTDKVALPTGITKDTATPSDIAGITTPSLMIPLHNEVHFTYEPPK